MDAPTEFDWLWLPLKVSIQKVLDSWEKEHYRLRRDVAFQLELGLERHLLDGHLTYPETKDNCGKVDLFVLGPSPEAAISVHLNGGPQWLPKPLKFGEIESDFRQIASLTDDGEAQVGVMIIFDEDFYPETPPAYEKVAEELAGHLGYRYTRLTSRNALCHIWWICSLMEGKQLDSGVEQ
jgi:hypothetical protein